MKTWSGRSVGGRPVTEQERTLFERLAAHHVPFILLRLVTATCFGPPYDDHMRALFGEANAQVEGTAGQWVLYLGSWAEYGYCLGPADGWEDILRQALELVDSGAVDRPELTRGELGIQDKPKEIPAALRTPVRTIKWGGLF